MQLMLIAKKVLYWAFVLCVALFVFVHFCRVSGVGGHGPAKIQRVLTGSAGKPYVYRVLLPMTANFLSPLLDKGTASRIGIRSERILGDRFFLVRLNGSLYPSQVVIILTMMYLSLAGFAVVTWFFLKDLGYGRGPKYAAPLILLLGSMVFMRFGYIYDLTALFLFSLGILLMFRRQWAAYLLAFALATLNKETAILLYPIFALYYFRHMTRRKFIMISISQLGIYSLTQGAIRFIYRANPGHSLEWHFYDQIAAFRQMAANTPWLLLYWISALVLLALLIGYQWGKKPKFLRVALSIFPIFVILFLLWGYPFEIRTMLEVYPIIAILILPPQLLNSERVAASLETRSLILP